MSGYNLYVVHGLANGTWQVAQVSGSAANYSQLPSTFSAYLSGVSGDSAWVNALDQFDLDTGSHVWSGYGLTVDEMVSAGRYVMKF